MNTTDAASEALYSGKPLAILEAAEQLFGNRGYEGTSVRDIAQEAGVNVAMISYYFGSKEGLLEALFASRIAAGRLVLEYLLSDNTLQPFEKIEILVDRLVDRMVDHHAFYRIMMRADLDKEHEAIGRMMRELKLKNLELVTLLIGEGQEKGVFVAGVDVSLLMMTMVGTIYQAATGSHQLIKSKTPDNAADPEFTSKLRMRLKAHLNHLFKAVLTYETK